MEFVLSLFIFWLIATTIILLITFISIEHKHYKGSGLIKFIKEGYKSFKIAYKELALSFAAFILITIIFGVFFGIMHLGT